MDLAVNLLLLAACIGICIALAILIIGTRLVRAFHSVWHRNRTSKLRPFILLILDGASPLGLSSRDALRLAEMVSDYTRHVRGRERDLLIRWLESIGYDRLCIRGMRSAIPFRRAHWLRRFAPLATKDAAQVVVMLRDPNVRVRILAAQVAGLSGNPAFVHTLLMAISSRRHSIPSGIIAMSVIRTAPPSATAFGRAFRSERPEVRALAIDLAGRLNLANARRDMEYGLAAPESTVREASLRALGHLGSPSSAAALTSFRASTEVEKELVSRARLAVSSL